MITKIRWKNKMHNENDFTNVIPKTIGINTKLFQNTAKEMLKASKRYSIVFNYKITYIILCLSETLKAGKALKLPKRLSHL